MSLKPVYLVDASIYLFRAWFSISDEFSTAAGQPTNAVYGFTGFLCSLLEQTNAEHIGVAFDVSLSKSYRNEIYPEYKANREPAPEELKRQFSWCRDWFRNTSPFLHWQLVRSWTWPPWPVFPTTPAGYSFRVTRFKSRRR